MGVKIHNMSSWFMISCALEHSYLRFGRMHFSVPEEGSRVLLRKFRNHLLDYIQL